MELDAILGESATSSTTVKTWGVYFKCGHTRTLHMKCSGRSKSATTEEIVRKVHKNIMIANCNEYCWVCWHIQRTSTSYFNRYFGYEKVVCKMSALFADLGWKIAVHNNIRTMFGAMQLQPNWFFGAFHYCGWDMDSLDQALIKQWTARDEKAPKKCSSAGKVTATVFWDSKGNLFWII